MIAMIVIMLTVMMGVVMESGLPNEAKEGCLAVYVICLGIAGMVVVVMAVVRPRDLVYGPREYLEESRLLHTRTLAEIRGRQA